MKKALFAGLALIAAISGIALASDSNITVPKGWHMAGMAPDDYETGLDRSVKRSGTSSAFVRAKAQPKDFSTLMQSIAPADYAGKRVRFSAFVKSDKVSDWAGLWMRVDGDNHETLSFDNMQDRAITGTTDWKQYEVILDVPAAATGIFFGILTNGTGTVWIDDAKIDVVPATVATTGARSTPALPRVPTNLGFED